MLETREKISQALSHYYRVAARQYHEGKQSLSQTDYGQFDEALADRLSNRYPIDILPTDISALVAGEGIDPKKSNVICEALVPENEDAVIRRQTIHNISSWVQQLYEAKLAQPEEVAQKSVETPDHTEMERRDKIARKRAKAFELNEDDKSRYRQYNPPNARLGAKSFVEVLEESFRRGDDFSMFIDHLSTEWNLTQDQIVEHLASLRNQHNHSRASAYYGLLSELKSHKNIKPLTIEQLAIDFGFDKKPPHLNKHILMLCRVKRNSKFNTPWNIDKDNQTLLDLQLDEAIHANNWHPLLKELVNAAGIPRPFMEQLTSFIPILEIGRTIESVESLVRIIETLNPLWNALPPERIQAQNVELVKLISRRSLDVKDAIEQSKHAANPGAALFKRLLGTTVANHQPPIASMSRSELLHEINAAKDPRTKNPLFSLTEKELRSTRVETSMPAGAIGHIDEELGKRIIEIFEKKAAFLIKNGYMAPLTSEIKNEMLDTLTNTRSATVLLKECIKDKISPQDMVIQIGKRRNIYRKKEIINAIDAYLASPGNPSNGHTGPATESFAGFKINRSAMENFLTGTPLFESRNAMAAALWMGLEGDDIKKFIVRARNKQSLNSDEIMQKLRKGQISKREALRELVDLTGKTITQIVVEQGVPRHALSFALNERENGVVICSREAADRLANFLGVSSEEFKGNFWRLPHEKPPPGGNGSAGPEVGGHAADVLAKRGAEPKPYMDL